MTKFRDIALELEGSKINVNLVRGVTLNGVLIKAEEDFFFFENKNPHQQPLPILYSAVSNFEIPQPDEQ